MNTPPDTAVAAGTTRPRRRAVLHRALVLALALALGPAASGVADACTLDVLLRLPLERLLELRIDDAPRVRHTTGPLRKRGLHRQGGTHAV